jgi:hypothetical protein
MRLSEDEVAFFKEYGYLIKQNVLDQDLCARCRDEFWRSLPPGSSIRRDDRSTWVGPVRADDELKEDRQNPRPDGGHDPDLRGYRWQAHKLGELDWVRYMLATNPEVQEMAEQLLGRGRLAEVTNIRGVYCTMPQGDTPPKLNGPAMIGEDTEVVEGRLKNSVSEPMEPNTLHGDREQCHNDAHGMHLGVVGLIDRVPPGGGSTMMWPGSHRRVFHLMGQQCMNGRLAHDGTWLEGQQGMNEDSAYADELRRLNLDTEPVDTFGETGTVVFWHHRCGHSASTNRSDQLRQAVLYDFRLQDLPEVGVEPPPEDMWRDWSPEVQQAPRQWSLQVAEEQRLVGRLVGGVRVTRENATRPLRTAEAAEAAAAPPAVATAGALQAKM